jgi:hypothetical protein
VDELAELDGTWARSRKGNLWCRLDGLTLSVFPFGDRWKWCVADRGGPRYSRESYPSSSAAAVQEEG